VQKYETNPVQVLPSESQVPRMRIFALNSTIRMLHYRFPGQAIVSKNGYFLEVQSFVSEGFIITDFNNKSKYIFVDSDNPDGLSPEFHQPYIISKED